MDDERKIPDPRASPGGFISWLWYKLAEFVIPNLGAALVGVAAALVAVCILLSTSLHFRNFLAAVFYDRTTGSTPDTEKRIETLRGENATLHGKIDALSKDNNAANATQSLTQKQLDEATKELKQTREESQRRASELEALNRRLTEQREADNQVITTLQNEIRKRGADLNQLDVRTKELQQELEKRKLNTYEGASTSVLDVALGKPGFINWCVGGNCYLNTRISVDLTNTTDHDVFVVATEMKLDTSRIGSIALSADSGFCNATYGECIARFRKGAVTNAGFSGTTADGQKYSHTWMVIPAKGKRRFFATRENMLFDNNEFRSKQFETNFLVWVGQPSQTRSDQPFVQTVIAPVGN